MNLKRQLEAEMNEELVKIFIELHKGQFDSIGLPEVHWKDLYMKLKEEVINLFVIFHLEQK